MLNLSEILSQVTPLLKKGEDAVLEGIERYLSEHPVLAGDAPDKLDSNSLDEVANAIGLFINVDVAAVSDNDRTAYIRVLIIVIRSYFVRLAEYFAKKDNETALEFINEFEEALIRTNLIYGNLSEVVKEMPFNNLRERLLSPGNSALARLTARPERLFWQGDKLTLGKLASLLNSDYDIINAPGRFQRFLSDPAVKTYLSVSRNKEGHFVHLINELKQAKMIHLKHGKGLWYYLSEVTYDFNGEKLAKNESSFKNLAYRIRSQKPRYKLIIKEIEEILGQLK